MLFIKFLDVKNKSNVSRLILTASGGPFLNKNLKDLKTVTREQAIKHPNWSMGKKYLLILLP